MNYTPLRLFRDADPAHAKAAKAAKAGDAMPSAATGEPSTRPAVATLAGLAALTPRNAGGHDLEERAAIVQEGAGVPTDWADGFARLEALPVPGGVSAKDWLAMMDAAGRFLDQWGGKAAALGWSAGELFGLDADAPMNRRDRRGAAFFLADCTVIAITAAEITVKTGGSVLRIPRRGGLTSPSWDAVRRGNPPPVN